MRIARALGLALLLASSSRLASGQLKYFGYVYGGESSTDLAASSTYTNTATTDGRVSEVQGVIVPESLVSRVVTMRSYGQLALIDLGQVLWVPNLSSGTCPANPNAEWCL